ncbi:5'-3' exonuclease [Aestuariimicrobium sp. Y1814]|uniref:5'-3' exonuclease n=1 Tax=Aestuariimicrobium sp. Y1814 TaxID=3418742 RepID=UPI003DA70797
MTSVPHRMVFDTATMYFRSFFGLPSSMVAPDGTQVNAVRGLLDSLARLIAQYGPTEIACAWDNDWRPTWRVDLVPSYKTHRLDPGRRTDVVGAAGKGAASGQAEEAPDALAAQVPIILDVLDAFGIPVVGVDDHEADDVLGSLAAASMLPTLVVTGDRDLFQLAHGDTVVVYIGKGVAKHELVDDAWLKQKYGVTAAQYVDFSVLRGDPSDGLPGVKGIGEKSAAQLVSTYGSLDGMVGAASDPESSMAKGLRAKLLESVDYLAAAREVVAVVTDLDVDDLELRTQAIRTDEARLEALATRWGLESSVERLRQALAAARGDGSS